jgi:hypothetical protein
MRGPLMMVAVDPTEHLHSTPLSLPAGFAKAPDIGDTFQFEGNGQKLRFKPFYSVQDETYNTYFTKQV